jgi:hypothetical protein
MGGSFACQFWPGPRPGSFAQRSESFLDKPLARPFDRCHARAYCLSYLLIFELLVGLQENPGTGQFAPMRFTTAAKAQQFVSFSRI